jgi:hypothetical protein
MAEVKNAFIKSKMNKDLDSRLLPSGEYRDGQNIQVSKSEGEDVGALENAVGNLPAETTSGANDVDNVDFSVLSGFSTGTLKSIGVYADTNTSNIFVFLTDFTEQPDIYPSVSYSPSANNYIYSYNTLNGNVTKIAQGAFLNFSTSNPIYGINLLEELLFWTDNRNQPRSIDISISANGTYYTSEDLISVATYNPYQAIDLYYQDTTTTPATPYYVTSMQDVTSPTFPNGAANTYYNPNWPGDPDYLENKFVTFSYRFKFRSGEYSIMAPFTQEAFIPKQDGYFLNEDEDSAYRSTIVDFMSNKVNSVGLYIPLPFAANDLSNSLNVEEIEILYKESDSLTVKALDSVTFDVFSKLENGNTNNTLKYLYDYQSRKPYKTLPESEIIRVYDKVPVRAFGQEVIGNRIVYSNFQDKHTPPATIDYDVAVTPKDEFLQPTDKALWTTSAVEYPMHNVKQNRNYQVGFILSDRYGRQSTTILSPINTELKTQDGITYGGSTFYHPYKVNPGAGNNDINSWPGDSLKILFNTAIDDGDVNLQTGWPGLYNGDAFSVNYNPLGWYSYKIVVKQTEQEYYNVYLPGILNDYPDFTSSQRSNAPDAQGTIAHIALLSDNVNKVPRDLTEVGPEQLQYRSDVRLFGRVTPNFDLNTAPTHNEPYYPIDNAMTAVSISEQNNMFLIATRAAPYNTIYQTDSDPYIARLSQNRVGAIPLPTAIGSSSVNSLTSAYKIVLGVFETAPVESLLEIFWETSTSGIISELNAVAGISTSADGWIQSSASGQTQDFVFNQSEASIVGEMITTTPFAPTYQQNFVSVPFVDSDVVLLEVKRASGQILYNSGMSSLNRYFNPIIKIVKGTGTDPQGFDTYNVQINKPLVFSEEPTDNRLLFKFSITGTNPVKETGLPVTLPLTLINKPPSITYPTPANISLPISVPGGRNPEDLENPIITFQGLNGALGSSIQEQTVGLVWSISNVLPALSSLEISADGVLTETSGNANGKYSFDLTVKDTNANTGALSFTQSINAIFGQEQISPNFGSFVSQSYTSKTFSKGMESAGLYWSADYSSVIDSSPVPGDMVNTGTGPNARSINQDVTLSNSGLIGSSINAEIKNENSSFLDSENEPWVLRNSNYKPSYFDTSLAVDSNTDSTLKNGTAYVKLDFQYKSWPKYDPSSSTSGYSVEEVYPNCGTQLGVAWSAYMQYRPDSTTDWITAVDVEGRDIRFGSSGGNILDLSGQGSSGALGQFTSSNSYLAQGFLNNSTESGAIANASNEDTVLATSEWVGCGQQNLNSSQSPPTAVVSKVFAFGKDQSYQTNSDKFGEYRLLVKYPQKDATSFEWRMIPSTTSTSSMQDFVLKRGASLTDSNIKVRVSFGDFYYPTPSVDSSFGYKIAINGSGNYQTASQIRPTVEVWAREWSMEYVTQFYTDSNLSTPYVGTFDNNYYSYSPLTQLPSNNPPFNTLNGSETASPLGIGSDIVASDSLVRDGIVNRRFVARFNGNGLKYSQSARPCTGNTQ